MDIAYQVVGSGPIDHLTFVGDQDGMLDRIAAFVTSAAAAKPRDCVLATVLSSRTDGDGPAVVAGTDFETHVQEQIAWFKGRGLVFTADGFFAASDGPARAISCARAVSAACSRFGRTGSFGLHTGECDLTPEGRVAGDVITVRSNIMEAGNKSVRIAHEMINDDTGEVVASMIVVGVHVDALTRRASALPADVTASMSDAHSVNAQAR